MFKFAKRGKFLKFRLLDVYIILVSGAYILWRILVLLKIITLK